MAFFFIIAKSQEQPKDSLTGEWMYKLVRLSHGLQLSNKKERNYCHLQQHGWICYKCSMKKEVWRGGQFSGNGNLGVMGLFGILTVVVVI